MILLQLLTRNALSWCLTFSVIWSLPWLTLTWWHCQQLSISAAKILSWKRGSWSRKCTCASNASTLCKSFQICIRASRKSFPPRYSALSRWASLRQELTWLEKAIQQCSWRALQRANLRSKSCMWKSCNIARWTMNSKIISSVKSRRQFCVLRAHFPCPDFEKNYLHKYKVVFDRPQIKSNSLLDHNKFN